MSWNEANKSCISVGARLVEITSKDENKAIVEEINRRGYPNRKMYFWMGLTDLSKEGTWKLQSSGQSAEYTNWDNSYKGKPEPDNHDGKEHCAHIRVGPKKNWKDTWADFICFERTLLIDCRYDCDRFNKTVRFSMNALCEFDAHSCKSQTPVRSEGKIFNRMHFQSSGPPFR